MAVWSEVLKSVVTHEHRLDAEFFDPKYLKINDLLVNLSCKDMLGKLANNVKKGIFDISPSRYKSKGVPLIRTFQIKTPIANEDNLVYINDIDHQNEFKKTELLPGDIVFTKIGAGIGDVAVLPETFSKFNFSQNVAGVSVKSESISSYYLISFLNSFYGRTQILRYMMPSGQGKLELRDIKKIIIPRFDASLETEVSKLMKSSEEKALLSKSLYTQAQELLEKELGLDMLVFPATLYSESSFVSVINGHRLDAPHYQNKFNILIDHLHKFPIQTIRKIRTVNRRGLQPKYIENGDFSVVNSQHITSTHLAYDNFERTSEAEYLRAKAAHILKDDVLIYTTGAYIGQTNLYDSEDPAMASNHVNVLRINCVDSAYLTMVLQSIVGKYQTQMHARGSAQAELYPSDIDKFFIPLLDDEKQLEIGNLLRQSLLAKRESENLLGEAKIMVEELIEGAI
ncbi:restriction endonuclease subunit S [Vibrio cholerae]|uniref:restriction endonuclease subunit S n=1 Tax=Vibrio cholerae TaxID=666 RepID=UPI0011D65E60|nr:restriction endonuclease subunit S [Vibrio cholerae]EGR2463967.1 restriction endonuclease subunit S [Vibrio cholerae]TXZ15848.1 hypothetical protein FXE59_02870 [Vibrio cholerae]GHX51673.1 type I restriction-modification system, S subunit, putative [Vibrio cholerae]